MPNLWVDLHKTQDVCKFLNISANSSDQSGSNILLSSLRTALLKFIYSLVPVKPCVVCDLALRSLAKQPQDWVFPERRSVVHTIVILPHEHKHSQQTSLGRFSFLLVKHTTNSLPNLCPVKFVLFFQNFSWSHPQLLVIFPCKLLPHISLYLPHSHLQSQYVRLPWFLALLITVSLPKIRPVKSIKVPIILTYQSTSEVSMYESQYPSVDELAQKIYEILYEYPENCVFLLYIEESPY